MKMGKAIEILTIKFKKAIEQELGCNFIRIDLVKVDCDIVRAIN